MNWVVLIVKPLANKRLLSNTIKIVFESQFNCGKDYAFITSKTITATKTMAEKHYSEHYGKEFYPRIIDGLTDESITVFLLNVQNESIVQELRDFTKSTIRPMFQLSTDPAHENVLHCSDSLESGAREKEIWFPEIV